jgi:hypothetical protein
VRDPAPLDRRLPVIKLGDVAVVGSAQARAARRPPGVTPQKPRNQLFPGQVQVPSTRRLFPGRVQKSGRNPDPHRWRLPVMAPEAFASRRERPALVQARRRAARSGAWTGAWPARGPRRGSPGSAREPAGPCRSCGSGRRGASRAAPPVVARGSLHDCAARGAIRCVTRGFTRASLGARKVAPESCQGVAQKKMHRTCRRPLEPGIRDCNPHCARARSQSKPLARDLLCACIRFPRIRLPSNLQELQKAEREPLELRRAPGMPNASAWVRSPVTASARPSASSTRSRTARSPASGWAAAVVRFPPFVVRSGPL